MPKPNVKEDGHYKKISALLDRWLIMHKGESFDLDLICRQNDIGDAISRDYVTQKLSYEVKQGRLDKTNLRGGRGGIYTIIDNTIKYINWTTANKRVRMELEFPWGVKDGSSFDFSKNVIVKPKKAIVIAGAGNAGKTAFVLNLLWNNFDRYHCVLMGNEYTDDEFAERTSYMDWANPLKEDGTPKFELIERHSGWKEAIQPNAINLIDWINLTDNFFEIGAIIEGMIEKLCNGIVVVVLQKDPSKQLGRGGTFSKDLATLYLSIDGVFSDGKLVYNRLTIEKAKVWETENPNNRMYGFEIANHGTQFKNIRPIKKCSVCGGLGRYRGNECNNCLGTGFVDIQSLEFSSP